MVLDIWIDGGFRRFEDRSIRDETIEFGLFRDGPTGLEVKTASCSDETRLTEPQDAPISLKRMETLKCQE